MMTMKWVDVGAIDDDVRAGGARCVNTPEGRIAVFRTAGDQVFAIEDHCPHKGGPLSQGIVHGSSGDMPAAQLGDFARDRKGARGADEGTVRTVPTRVEGHRLFIALGAVAEEAA